MPLKGELSDLSLSELIEFFCNQRKTGRLEVIYLNGSAELYLQSGSLVHAQIGVLRGVEAVYYALTQSNASFKFSPEVEAREQTINQPWSAVVLEGLRRMDEAVTPANAFPETAAKTAKKAIEQAVEKPTAADRVPVAVQQSAERVETYKEKESVVVQQSAESADTYKEKEPAGQMAVVDSLEPSRMLSLPKRSPATSPLFAEVEAAGTPA